LRIFETQDGSHSILSEKYGVSYHSKYGAIQETQHVFIDAALRPKALSQKGISILGIGFGTGLNAFMTYLEAEKYQWKINYVGIEAFPISIEEAHQLNYPETLNQPNKAADFLKMHESNWSKLVDFSDYFKLEKRKMLFQEIDFQNQFDVIYFDAFAPTAQPELWEPTIMQKMYNALKKDGILVTYCAKGVVKRTLKGVGFVVESLKGPPGKREMTRAIKK
jgi:tRNA U34 5-methylaminomethyl-2-thiouridine-forming methyltransferase MnmC